MILSHNAAQALARILLTAHGTAYTYTRTDGTRHPLTLARITRTPATVSDATTSIDATQETFLASTAALTAAGLTPQPGERITAADGQAWTLTQPTPNAPPAAAIGPHGALTKLWTIDAP